MKFNNEGFEDIKSTVSEETITQEERIKYAYLLMGYHDAILSLYNLLSYESEPVQTLVGLVYTLIKNLKWCFVDCDLEYTPVDFAKEHIANCNCIKNDLMETDGKEEFDFLINALTYFGANG